MNRKEHQVVISLFLAVAILFMFSMYDDASNFSGNVVNSGDELELINCEIIDGFEVCDVHGNGEIIEEGYRKKV